MNKNKISSIDSTYIKNKMLAKHISLKQMHQDTGINYTTLSALVNGVKPLSQSMKAMFYYYLKSK